MAARGRTYWLTEACRVRREDQSLRIERTSGGPVHIPVTDVTDLVAFAPVDINTSAVSLLGHHKISLHLLDHYGNYTGIIAPAEAGPSGHIVVAQVLAFIDERTRLDLSRAVVGAACANVRWSLDTPLLDKPLETARAGLREATTIESLMSVEGNFRRTSWAALDELLPPWLRLQGRSRRPPANAGNAFISFVNGIVYARVLTAIRTTPLHPSVSFLDAIDSRQRYPLALDLAEPFRPLFAERLILRSASRRVLQPSDFEQDVASAALSAQGRKKVVTLVRDELDGTVYHRSLRRKVTYAELMHLEALKLVRLLLEGAPYRAFHPWW